MQTISLLRHLDDVESESASSRILLCGKSFQADPTGALWWRGEQTLILADLQLSNGSYLDGEDVMLPPFDTRSAFEKLEEALDRFDPERVIALGNSFSGSDDGGLTHHQIDWLQDMMEGRDWYWVMSPNNSPVPDAIGGVAAGAQQYLFQQPCAAVGQEPQELQGLVQRFAAHERGERPNLPGRHIGKSMVCCVLHGSCAPFYLAAPAAAALALPPLCPLNVRVGANSPSLWPTMSSVTYSFMKTLPLWMAKFLPMNSGTIVQARAHVLMASRAPPAFIRSTLANNFGSTNGPFLSDRPMGT